MNKRLIIKILKTGFYCACIGVCVDFAVRFASFRFDGPEKIFSDDGTFMGYVRRPLPFIFWEALILSAAFLGYLQVSAIWEMPFSGGRAYDKFPLKRYVMFAAVIGASLSVLVWTPRFISYGVDFASPITFQILLGAFVYILTAAVISAVLFLAFYAAYRIAKRNTAAERAARNSHA